MLSKMLANLTQQYIKKIIYYEKNEFHFRNAGPTIFKNQTVYFSTLTNDQNHMTISILGRNHIQLCLILTQV